MTLQIRPAQVSDAAAIAEVQIRTWRALYEGLMSAETLADQSVARRTAQWEPWPLPTAGRLVLVAVRGRAIGAGPRRSRARARGDRARSRSGSWPRTTGRGASTSARGRCGMAQKTAEPVGGAPVGEVRYRRSLSDPSPTGA